MFLFAERKSCAFPAVYLKIPAAMPPKSGGIAARKIYLASSEKHSFSARQEESGSLSMFKISRTTPAYYFTSVTHHRLPIFRTDELKQVLCDAYNEVRSKHGIFLLAYVIMHDHVHLLVYSQKGMSDALRLLNGVAARRIIQYLTYNGHEKSLFKLRGETRERNHKHSVWQHHPDSLDIFGEDTFRQKVDYIHLNPVRAGLTADPLDYKYSSARSWAGISVDKPILTDHLEIDWR